MSKWQQYYYTWSTKSLSQNRVGLGIVAASDRDRNSLLTAGQMAGKCDVIRSGREVTVERFCYNAEIPGYVRMGATACEQAADQRNNKFVHVYTLTEEGPLAPEHYFIPLTYEKKWDGESGLIPIEYETRDIGRGYAIEIAKEYRLEKRLPELICCVYRCMLSGEKPLMIEHSGISAEEFGEFSRKMMILIHYLLPVSLRKEADSISYTEEETQEVRFLFGRTAGKFSFSMEREKKREYSFLEEEFYKKLAQAFLRESSTFERYMNKAEKLLSGLADKRNQLEKCIFALMVSVMGKEKKDADFYAAAERLMYWARNDKSLVPVLKEAIKELDFHKMNESELSSYVSLLLTGAGGQTKKMAYDELSQMLTWCFEKEEERFRSLLSGIREKNNAAYIGLLEKNRESAFVKAVLFAPLENKKELKESYRHHKALFKDYFFRDHFVNEAYRVYRNSKKEADRAAIEKMAKAADEKAFVELKLADVENVFLQAENLEGFIAIEEQMDLLSMEDIIRDAVYDSLTGFMKEQEDMDERIAERYRYSAELLGKEEDMISELKKKFAISFTEEQTEDSSEQLLKQTEQEKGEKPMDAKGKQMLRQMMEDIMTGSLWAFFLGFYGYLFISLREMRSFLTGYRVSIGILVFFVAVYLLSHFLSRKKVAPGTILYVLGVGIFLMNLGLSLDTSGAVYALYIISGVLSILLRMVYHIFFGKEREEEA